MPGISLSFSDPIGQDDPGISDTQTTKKVEKHVLEER
jgi:hypothetical protein